MQDGGIDSGNHQNFSDDDEHGYERTPQLEPTITGFVESELPQLNEEGRQIMDTVVTYTQNASRQSKKQS